jgi:DNA-binding NarL/FixJ family response regulator
MKKYSHIGNKSIYSRENDQYLKMACEVFQENSREIIWNEVKKSYNQQFQDSKTIKQLRKHFDCISGELRTGPLSPEEVETFERLIKEGKNISTVAKKMKREENSIKNHFRRKFKNKENKPPQ